MKVVINPPNALWRLLSEKHWDAAISMLDMDQNFRSQAAKKLSASNCPGTLCPLHFALLEGAPVKLVLELLKAHPEAAMYHYNHETPLHIAIKQKRPLAIIKALSLAYPESFQQTRNGKDLGILIRKCYKHECLHERDVLCYFEGIVASSGINLINDSNILVVTGESGGGDSSRSVSREGTPLECAGAGTIQMITNSLNEIKSMQSILVENQERIEGALLELAQNLSDMKLPPSTELKDSIEADLSCLKREVKADIHDLEMKIYDMQASSSSMKSENKDNQHDDDKTDAETYDSGSFVDIT